MHAHIARGGPSVPQFFVTYMRARSMRNDNQILHDDQNKNLQGRPRMMTRDLFAVANLLNNVA